MIDQQEMYKIAEMIHSHRNYNTRLEDVVALDADKQPHVLDVYVSIGCTRNHTEVKLSALGIATGQLVIDVVYITDHKVQTEVSWPKHPVLVLVTKSILVQLGLHKLMGD